MKMDVDIFDQQIVEKASVSDFHKLLLRMEEVTKTNQAILVSQGELL